MPARLISFIEEEYPPYRTLSPKNKGRIAIMLWAWTDLSLRHNSSQDSIAFTKRRILRIWGNDTTMRQILGKNYFSVLGGNNFSRKANAFVPMDYLGRALFKCLLSTEPDDLVTITGDGVRANGRAILSLARDHGKATKKSVWSGVDCAKWVPINVDALQEFLFNSEDPRDILAALRLIRLSRNTGRPGLIPVQYEQQSSGRIFEVLSSLQNTPRNARNAALCGYWDYDISNCHFAILSAWGKQLGHLSPTIDQYLSNKSAIREQLASECETTVDPIKQALISLVYGAPLNPDGRISSIKDHLGAKPARIFAKNNFVISLANEIKFIGKKVVESLPRHKSQIGNTLRIFTSTKGKNEKPKSFASHLSHALQGVEASALREVLRLRSKNILLCLHDGWVSDMRLATDQLETAILSATGFALKIEENQLTKSWESAKAKIHEDNSQNTDYFNKDHWFKYFENKFCSTNTLPPSGGLVVSCCPAWNRLDGISGPASRSVAARKRLWDAS